MAWSYHFFSQPQAFQALRDRNDTRRKGFVVVIAIVAAMGGLIFGYGACTQSLDSLCSSFVCLYIFRIHCFLPDSFALYNRNCVACNIFSQILVVLERHLKW